MIGIGALGVAPPNGSVAICPAAFDLPYGTIPERVSIQARLKAVMGLEHLSAEQIKTRFGAHLGNQGQAAVE
ncbi:hypothetical protein GCM10010981_33680 [Dyella nitratireducens]|uniref:Uncharacterized protein n=1 Tax=Dyella nitratireducens TaxID=1849580 RepID=A0ABQ1GDY4_9GAMM|nr:hypothetical protein GCM10010981_33680 [Dyella nitratireducens]GLQ42076.1 hypothetical protein GCM10007902_19260 [Dyella nitratireducens]